MLCKRLLVSLSPLSHNRTVRLGKPVDGSSLLHSETCLMLYVTGSLVGNVIRENGPESRASLAVGELPVDSPITLCSVGLGQAFDKLALALLVEDLGFHDAGQEKCSWLWTDKAE